MEQPLDPLVSELVELLDDDQCEAFEERAAIIEFDAGLQRAHAECLALLSVLRRYPDVIAGVTVLQFQLDGVPHWLLATDLELAGRHIAHLGAVEVTTVPLAQVVGSTCGGLAKLASAIS